MMAQITLALLASGASAAITSALTHLPSPRPPLHHPEHQPRMQLAPEGFTWADAPPAAAPAAPPTPRLAAQALCDWVAAQDGALVNAVPGPTPHGLGLYARDELAPGAVAVAVPAACMLSSAEAEAPDLAPLCASVPSEQWAARLAFSLLAERAKGDASRLAEYVRALPAAYTAPLFWSREAVGTLRYPPVQRRLVERAKLVSQLASELGVHDGAAFSGAHVGVDALGWAVAACSSRAISLGDGDAARALVPVVDLANHAAAGSANCELRALPGGAVQLVALRPIPLGEELTRCCARAKMPNPACGSTSRAQPHVTSSPLVPSHHSTLPSAAPPCRPSLPPDGDGLATDDFLLDYGFLPLEAGPADTLELAWGEGELLQSACTTAGVSAKLAEWQQAALRAALPQPLPTVTIGRKGAPPHALPSRHRALALCASELALGSCPRVSRRCGRPRPGRVPHRVCDGRGGAAGGGRRARGAAASVSRGERAARGGGDGGDRAHFAAGGA